MAPDGSEITASGIDVAVTQGSWPVQTRLTSHCLSMVINRIWPLWCDGILNGFFSWEGMIKLHSTIGGLNGGQTFNAHWRQLPPGLGLCRVPGLPCLGPAWLVRASPEGSRPRVGQLRRHCKHTSGPASRISSGATALFPTSTRPSQGLFPRHPTPDGV